MADNREGYPRRELFRILGGGAAATAAGSAAPPQRGQEPSTTSEPTVKAPKVFSPHEEKTLRQLCDILVPGSVEAGAFEYIALLAAERQEFATRYHGGLQLFDTECNKRYGRTFVDCSQPEKKEFLDLIAHKDKVAGELSHARSFFEFVRRQSAEAFYTSEAGVKELGYVGNSALAEFPGCEEPG